MRKIILLIAISLSVIAEHAQTFVGPIDIIVQSGELKLAAQVWRPKGDGPFPGILFNHGRGGIPKLEVIGPLFAQHGYVLFALFRRGEGLSAKQGTFINELVDRESKEKGADAGKRLQVQLMETDHLADTLNGLSTLKKLPYVDPNRLGVVGHSFGGSLALLLAERDKKLRAGINFAGAAASWDGSPYLRQRLMNAVAHVNTPILFIYAENDYSINPGKALDAEMTRLHKVHQLKLFPPQGKNAAEAHSLIYNNVAAWESDVFAFLKKYM